MDKTINQLDLQEVLDPTSIHVSHYLGSGAFADVYFGTLKQGDETIDVAIKRLKPSSQQKMVAREANMSHLDYKYLVKIFGWFNAPPITCPDDPKKPANDKEVTHIVMEYCGGGDVQSLLDFENISKQVRIRICL